MFCDNVVGDTTGLTERTTNLEVIPDLECMGRRISNLATTNAHLTKEIDHDER